MDQVHAFDDKYYINLHDARGVAIGPHSAIYQIFLEERYRSLAEHLITFDDLITERTADFVGRAFLDARLATFMEQHDRGYFMLVGEPGIGKTAWAAHIVRKYQALHHFNSRAKGIIQSSKCLENLCVQLITRFQLDRPYLPINAGGDGSLLNKLLNQTANLLNGGKLVIVIDALDEMLSSDVTRSSDLFLPESLPKGAYIILTTRPKWNGFLCPEPVDVFELGDSTAVNEADIRSYIMAYARVGRMPIRLGNGGLTVADLMEELTRKSEGNFMYLHHVLRDIEMTEIKEGEFKEFLKKLPWGLKGYYEAHWRQMRDENEDRWVNYRLPVIYRLAVAQEPVTISDLAIWARLSRPYVLEAVRRWREFLSEEIRSQQKYYYLYHAVFQEYLREKDEVKIAQTAI